MKLGTFLKPGSTIVIEAPSLWPDVARALAQRAVGDKPDIDEDALYEPLCAANVPVENEVAFPHARVEGLEQTVLVVALVRGGVELSGERVGLLFLLAGPPDAAWQHLGLLARLARLCHRPGLSSRLRGSVDAEDLLARLQSEDSNG